MGKTRAVAVIGFGARAQNDPGFRHNYLFQYRIFLTMLIDFGNRGESVDIFIITREEIVAAHPPDARHAKNIFVADDDQGVVELLRALGAGFAFVWNGFDQQVLLDSMRGQMIIPIFCELGWLPQRETITFDFCGVNGGSLFARYWENSRAAYAVESGRRWREKYVASLPSAQDIPGFPENGILIPLQLEQDSNILAYSPFSTMRQLVEFCLEIFAEHVIIVRPHPADPLVDFSDLGPRCKMMREAPLYDMIRSADLIVGINSTVLIQALLFQKKVVGLGQSIGTNKGVFAGEWPLALENAADLQRASVDIDAVDSFIHELVTHRQLYYSDFANGGRVRENVVLNRLLAGR